MILIVVRIHTLTQANLDMAVVQIQMHMRMKGNKNAFEDQMKLCWCTVASNEKRTLTFGGCATVQSVTQLQFR